MTLSVLWRSLYGAWFASEVLILVVTRTRRGAGKLSDRGSLLILWPVIALSITAASWIGEAHPPTMFAGADWVRTLGVIVMTFGLAIRWTAIVTLGKSFSVNVAIHTTQTVHKTGLFHFVRHPSYSGLLLIFAAIGIHNRNWLSLVVVLVPATAALLYRIHVEEAALAAAFGSEYVDYCRVTKRLVPGIY